MKKGQGSLEYLFLIAVAIIIVAVVIRYVEPAAKEVPITGITYIDTDTPSDEIIYKYPEGCRARRNCDFYVQVAVRRYRPARKDYVVRVRINADTDKIRKVKVQFCTGKEVIWQLPRERGVNKRVIIPESEFPCTLYIMAWMK